MKIFKLPDLGEGLPEAEIRTWHVQEGDMITADQLMVSMETAKAVVDVPAPRSGRIIKLYGKPGDVIETGKPLVEFEDGTDSQAENAASTVVGAIEVGTKILEESPTGIAQHKSAEQAIKAMPAVRALAKQLGVDLSAVKATGPGGQVTVQDVQLMAQKGQEQGSQVSASSSVAAFTGGERLSALRRAMAQAMIKSHQEVVAVTLVDDADITHWIKGTDFTIRLIQAVLKACEAEPSLNAWFDGQTMTRKIHSEVHLGLAVDTQEGLMVPVLKNAQAQSAEQLRNQVNQYKQLAETREIAPDAMQGATFTLSNFGTFAGRYANPIIVPPCVAILGSGRCYEQLALINGEVKVTRKLPLSLTMDHRAVTGGEASRFLRAVIDQLMS